MVSKSNVKMSLPEDCWKCSTTWLYVREISLTDQFPLGHSILELGGAASRRYRLRGARSWIPRTAPRARAKGLRDMSELHPPSSGVRGGELDERT